MERLYPLIRTPRAAKTFVNVYRVFRSSLERPLLGEPNLRDYLQQKLYPTPMLLLALQVGDPRLSESFQGPVLAERETLEACLFELQGKFTIGALVSALPLSRIKTRSS